MTKSLCDRCFQPGECCKKLYLWIRDQIVGAPAGVPISFPLDTWRADAAVWLAEQRATYKERGVDMPLQADHVGGIWWHEGEKRWYAQIRWSCPALLPNGRCGIYATRPELCRVFEPGSDSLCVHHVPQEAGDPTLNLGGPYHVPSCKSK